MTIIEGVICFYSDSFRDIYYNFGWNLSGYLYSYREVIELWVGNLDLSIDYYKTFLVSKIFFIILFFSYILAVLSSSMSLFRSTLKFAFYFRCDYYFNFVSSLLSIYYECKSFWSIKSKLKLCLVFNNLDYFCYLTNTLD